MGLRPVIGKTIPLYYRTLKPLKLKQWGYRLLRQGHFFTFLNPPQDMPVIRSLEGKWIKPPSPVKKTDPLTFDFLNQEGPENGQGMNRLWNYNLHYHAVVVSDATPTLKSQILRQWMQDNPWGKGTGWEPYPLSLRIVNWIKFFVESGEGAEFQKSLYAQCCALDRQIEYHLLGNHLFENAKALVFAGLYFDTPRSHRWLRKGVSLLQDQLKEQILKDGGHFERSPMYHALILEGLLDLYQIIKSTPEVNLTTQIQTLIPSMLRWLSGLSHLDGNIGFFNDTTLGVAPEPATLYKYAEALGFSPPTPLPSLTHFQESGFIRAQNAEALILADIGSVGPSYLPGHAHAETLSFEMSLGKERIFVNSGISTYERGEERQYQRSSQAHNTLVIDGENSSEVWASFRVGHRAHAFNTASFQEKARIAFSASHDGYGFIHTREWHLSPHELVLRDKVEGKGRAPEITLYFHLHPQWQVNTKEPQGVFLYSKTSPYKVLMHFPKGSLIEQMPYAYAIGFNKTLQGTCLKIFPVKQTLSNTFETRIEWTR